MELEAWKNEPVQFEPAISLSRCPKLDDNIHCNIVKRKEAVLPWSQLV